MQLNTQIEDKSAYLYMQDGFDMSIHVLAGETSKLLNQNLIPVYAVDKATGERAQCSILGAKRWTL